MQCIMEPRNFFDCYAAKSMLRASHVIIQYICSDTLYIPQLWRRKGLEADPLRESPPECLSDPMLGRHLYVKINVGSLVWKKHLKEVES